MMTNSNRTKKSLLAIILSVLMIATCLPAFAFADSVGEGLSVAELKEAMNNAKQAMDNAKEAMNKAKDDLDEYEQDYNEKKDAADDAARLAAEAESTKNTAETARDNAFAAKKTEAQNAYDAAVETYENAVSEYNGAVAAVNTKTQELEALNDQKTELEGEISSLNNEIQAAQQLVNSLPAEINTAKTAVNSANTQWTQEKEAADQAVAEAQAAAAAAGRDFINQKINDNNGYDLDTMIAACKSFTNASITPISDSSGNRYSTVADVANSANFEKVVDRACTYENLKKSIEYIREANYHRNLSIHNAGSLKVSYQLMGTAIITNAISVYQTGHNLLQGDTDWLFWDSGNSYVSAENLAYSQASSEMGWDPFHGWYYKERMRVLANQAGTATVSQSIVDRVLQESDANGFPYNPYGYPWYQSEDGFRNNISNAVGHYNSLINSNYKATGFSYIDGLDYKVSTYPYVAAQEFNGDTSKSVSVDQYEQQLEAWFEDYLNALADAQDAREALDSKPQYVVDAEQTLAEKEQALADSQQTLTEKTAAKTEKENELQDINEDIETKNQELVSANAEKAVKELVKSQAETNKTAKKAENDKAQALDVNTASTYEDYDDLKQLANAYNDAASDYNQKQQKKTDAESARDDAKALYDSAAEQYETKMSAYETAVEEYNEAKAAFDAAVNIENAEITVNDVTYNGRAQTPNPVVILNGETLVKGVNYTVSYENNTNAGTNARLTVSGKGDYQNSKTVSFTILRKPIDDNMFELKDVPAEYQGSQIKPGICYTGLVISDCDKTFGENLNVGQGWVKFTGKGNYQGTVTKYFDIIKAENEITKFTVTGGELGSTLYRWNTDARFGADKAEIYFSTSKDGPYSKTSPTKAGTYYAKAIIPGTDNYYAVESDPVAFEIKAQSNPPSGSITILNTIANSAKKTNDVIWDKSKVKNATNYEINWRARGVGKWASTTVGNTVRGTTSGLSIKGLYEIRVRAKNAAGAGPWSNTVYRYFHTTEKIRLASKSKGSFTMSWKNNPQATSYQVMFTTNKNGSGAAKNINTVGKGKTSFTKSGLKSGVTYYVQVREMRKVGNITYVGNISCPVAVKVK